MITAFPPCAFFVRIKCQPVIVECQHGPSQVLERWDRYEGAAVGSEHHLRYHLHFLCCQSAAFPLFPPLTEVCGGVPALEGQLCNKHVTLGTSGVGSVALFQYHNCVPHMAVQKVNPEVGLVCCSPWTPLHWAPDSCQHRGERDPIRLGLPRGWGGVASPAPPCPTPCQIWRCTRMDPAANYMPHSGHCTRCRSRAR